MMFRLIGRFLLPLSADQLADTLVDEVNVGISDGSSLLDKIERRKIFNHIYDTEIQEIYENETMIRQLFQRIHPRPNQESEESIMKTSQEV